MKGFWQFISHRSPTAKPLLWRKAIMSDNEWRGYVGETRLFTVKREEFIETGETFCLESQLDSRCVCCYPTLELACSHAQEQWQKLVQCGVE